MRSFLLLFLSLLTMVFAVPIEASEQPTFNLEYPLKPPKPVVFIHHAEPEKHEFLCGTWQYTLLTINPESLKYSELGNSKAYLQ